MCVGLMMRHTKIFCEDRYNNAIDLLTLFLVDKACSYLFLLDNIPVVNIVILMVNARELMVQTMLSRAIARGTKVKLSTLGTLSPDPMDVAFVTRTIADA